VFAVGSKAEADLLQRLSCERGVVDAQPDNPWGYGVVGRLRDEQTLDELAQFSLDLADLHDEVVRMGRCDCDPGWWERWTASLPREDEDEEEDDEVQV
jgi:hypothetical protein